MQPMPNQINWEINPNRAHCSTNMTTNYIISTEPTRLPSFEPISPKTNHPFSLLRSHPTTLQSTVCALRLFAKFSIISRARRLPPIFTDQWNLKRKLFDVSLIFGTHLLPSSILLLFLSAASWNSKTPAL
jgi:hypothetical protein